MSNRGTTSTGLWVEFQAAVLRQLPRPEDAESTVFEGWTKNQDALKSALVTALLPSVSNRPDDIDWQKAYKVLGMEAEYAEFTKAGGIKEDQNLWVVPVVKGVTCNKVVAMLRNLKVDVYTYVNDLDKGVSTNDRDPTTAHTQSVLRESWKPMRPIKNSRPICSRSVTIRASHFWNACFSSWDTLWRRESISTKRMRHSVRVRATLTAAFPTSTGFLTFARSMSAGTTPAVTLTVAFFVPVPQFFDREQLCCVAVI